MPSTPSDSCTNAPNFVTLTTGPSTTEPAANRCATSAQGSPNACFRPRDMRCSPAFTPRTTASTISPGFTSVLALLNFLPHDISETWMRPSIPGSSSTNAPNSATRVTVPRTRSPTWYFPATASQGCGCNCLIPTEIRCLPESLV